MTKINGATELAGDSAEDFAPMCETCGINKATLETGNDWKVCDDCAGKLEAKGLSETNGD